MSDRIFVETCRGLLYRGYAAAHIGLKGAYLSLERGPRGPSSPAALERPASKGRSEFTGTRARTSSVRSGERASGALAFRSSAKRRAGGVIPPAQAPTSDRDPRGRNEGLDTMPPGKQGWEEPESSSRWRDTGDALRGPAIDPVRIDATDIQMRMLSRYCLAWRALAAIIMAAPRTRPARGRLEDRARHEGVRAAGKRQALIKSGNWAQDRPSLS